MDQVETTLAQFVRNNNNSWKFDEATSQRASRHEDGGRGCRKPDILRGTREQVARRVAIEVVRPATVFSGLLAQLVWLVTSLYFIAPTVAVLPFLCRVSSLCFGLCSQFVLFARLGVVILYLAQFTPLTTRH